MTEWEPATDAEAAMQEALRSGDQELYFRILSRTELLLPVSADALAGRVPLGWGTWTTGGRTHVLAFTSSVALQACLAEHAGSARTVVYHELAAAWPNIEWWLAVNPGLPIEGYLPAWFVAQLARGDVRLPGRAAGSRAAGEEPAGIAGPAVVPGQPSGSGPAAPHPVGSYPGAPYRAETYPAATFPNGAADPAASGPPEPATAPTGLASSMITPPPAPGSSAPTPAGAGSPAVAPAVAGRSAEAGLPSALAPPAGRSAEAGPPSAAATGAGASGPAAHLAAAAPTLPSTGAPSVPVAPVPHADQAAQSPGGPLPRRPVPSPSEQPQSMAAVARSIAPSRPVPPPRAFTASPVDRPPAGPEPGAASSPADRPPGPVPDGRAAGAAGFRPANQVEEGLLAAANDGNTEGYLSTLLLARVLVPVSGRVPPEGGTAGEAFPWRTEDIDGEQYVVVFTSSERMAEHMSERAETVTVKFVQLIRRWPNPAWSFAVNPGTPVGASLPGSQILALANWATDMGLGQDDTAPVAPADAAEPAPAQAGGGAQTPTVMQKAVAPHHVDYYLERGYDRVSGFVHRAEEVQHLRTPESLHVALGLGYAGSPFRRDAEEMYVLRWSAYRPSLYRIPYGGQSESAMRAMQGWVIERPPFRGNGFAPGESSEVIAEFKLDSVRLPHGAQLWRIGADGAEKLVALFDGDTPGWRRVGGH